jgi:hypothetical protein
MRLMVGIDDDNDNEPKFDRPSYEFDVVENSPPGTTVGRVHAEDKDIGINGRISYQLLTTQSQQEGNEHNKFVIDHESGVIYVGSTLDYERGSEYRLRVTAQDMSPYDETGDDGNEKSTTTTSGRLSPRPASASAPNRKQSSGNVSLTGDSTRSGQVNATTAAALRNDIISGRGRNYPSGSLMGYATVRIRVVDRNDNAPRVVVNTFRSPQDVAVISESAATGTFVAYVTASDADAGSNGMVTCSIRSVSDEETYVDGDDIRVNNDGNRFRLEMMSSSTSAVVEYRLVTASGLDRERTRRHVISVACRDLAGSGEVSRESRVDVVVEVADENDHPPRFERQTYECDIVENNAIGDVIAVVKATDEDHGANGQVS